MHDRIPRSPQNNAYIFEIAQTKEGGLYLGYEGSGKKYSYSTESENYNYLYNSNLAESEFAKSSIEKNTTLQGYMRSLKIYHFHDTSATSMLRKEGDISDNREMKSDGRNLSAFLYFLKEKHPIVYKRIETTIQSVAPYIDRLILEPNNLNEKEIELRWVDAADMESNFSAYQLSDGTLRFIALTAVLLQPNPPSVIIIDEPELGLHPLAIGKLAGMIQAASTKAQVVVSTQSVNLLDYFEPEDIVAVDRNKHEEQSVFMRLSTNKLKVWLEDYTLGDLWQRNIIDSAQPFIK